METLEKHHRMPLPPGPMVASIFPPEVVSRLQSYAVTYDLQGLDRYTLELRMRFPHMFRVDSEWLKRVRPQTTTL